MFKTIEGNRPLNPQHVNRLASSIEVNGYLVNPIIVNQNYYCIDGNHRLAAARIANSPIYYFIVNDYNLQQVHVLNQNQKNWTTADFLEGYAAMGIRDYIILKDFLDRHDCFNIGDCIAMCSNITNSKGDTFKDGMWKVRNMAQAERAAENLKLLEAYYEGYTTSTFVGAMLSLFKNKNFIFKEFIAKLKLQPTALIDCKRREQTIALIEQIYNYRRKDKVNLRYAMVEEEN